MISITPTQAKAFRKLITDGADANMIVDIGYFMTWFSGVELGITFLLAVASRTADYETFDTLCAGMDARVKIERLRRVLKKRKIQIGPNLSARLTYFDEKARRLRNRLAHSYMGRDERADGVYFASSMGSLPWRELGEEMPKFSTSPPVSVPAEQLLGWGAWFNVFCKDLQQASQLAVETGEFEIKNPATKVPRGGQETPPPEAPPTTLDTRDQTSDG